MKKMKKLKKTMTKTMVEEKPTATYRTSAPPELRVAVQYETPQNSGATGSTPCSLWECQGSPDKLEADRTEAAMAAATASTANGLPENPKWISMPRPPRSNFVEAVLVWHFQGNWVWLCFLWISRRLRRRLWLRPRRCRMCRARPSQPCGDRVSRLPICPMASASLLCIFSFSRRFLRRTHFRLMALPERWSWWWLQNYL